MSELSPALNISVELRWYCICSTQSKSNTQVCKHTHIYWVVCSVDIMDPMEHLPYLLQRNGVISLIFLFCFLMFLKHFI